MATDVIMPALGMAQEKGSLVSWLKAEGEQVAKGEPLMQVETDKATVEIEAPASGILADVSAAPGDEVPVGRRIAVILAPGETAAEKNAAVAAAPGRTPSTSPGRPPTTQPEPVTSTPPGRVAASPAARRLAREKNIDLGALKKGSGPQGEIVAEDVLRAAPEKAAPSRIVPLSAMRRIVGERMTKSKQSAPHFYVSVDVDMAAVNRMRKEWKEKKEPVIPSINDFILWATARALKEFPSFNSALVENGIQHFTDINLGVAVAIEEGLVVPVIRNADRCTLHELASRSRELAEKAARKKLFPLDYEGGTFTVSNLGMLGVDSFVAIINPPQCAILAVGQVAERAVVRGGEIVVRPMMTMTLSADHRMTDGAVAARFLQEVKGLLEKAA